MEIADSARRHEVPDEDMHHAVRNPIRLVWQAQNRLLVIGPDCTGQPLEVVVLDPETQPVVIHAMILRPSSYRCLMR
jgi:hypothetical protein